MCPDYPNDGVDSKVLPLIAENKKSLWWHIYPNIGPNFKILQQRAKNNNVSYIDTYIFLIDNGERFQDPPYKGANNQIPYDGRSIYRSYNSK